MKFNFISHPQISVEKTEIQTQMHKVLGGITPDNLG